MSDEFDSDGDVTESPPDQHMTDDNEDGMEQLVTDSGSDSDGAEPITEESTGQEPNENPTESSTDGDDVADGIDDLRQKLNYALLAGLSLLALIAALQFYFNASSAINQWVTREYRSLFQAVFNLVVLLLAAAGISRQVRRLTA